MDNRSQFTAHTARLDGPPSSRPPHDVRPLPRLRLALALAVIAYGVVTMACGSSNENTRETQPVERPEYGPWEEGQPQQAPDPSEVAAAQAQGQTIATAEAPDPGGLPAAETAAGASAPLAAAGAGAAPAADLAHDVRFAVDDAGLEMAMPMARHGEASADPAQTSAVLSGDWFLQNFVYRGPQLDTTDVTDAGNPIPEATVVAMRHRRADAEIVVWTEPQSPLDAERFLDVVADDLVGRVVTAPELVDVAVVTLDPQVLAAHLEGLALHESSVAGRPALQVDLQRTNPATRIRERTRVLTVRQHTDAGAVLVHVALTARPDDFERFTADLARTAGRIQLGGRAEPLALNPDRQLGTLTDAYGLDLQPLEVEPMALAPADDAGVATATRAAATAAEAISSAARRLLAAQPVDEPATEPGPEPAVEPAAPAPRPRPSRGL